MNFPYQIIKAGASGYLIWNIEQRRVEIHLLLDEKTANDVYEALKIAWCASEGKNEDGSWKH
jgi:hypothetical protein